MVGPSREGGCIFNCFDIAFENTPTMIAPIDGLHGFTSGGQESGCAFGAVVCKIQARKCYTESMSSAPNDK